jgi:HPt (histidine-containing phosphotransfer) domain-containing protein
VPDKIINDSVPNERRRVGESVVNSKSPIDATAIINLRDEGDDLLADLINLFLSETPKRLGKIERGLASADWQTVRIAAHTLRGTGATFGAARMRELARQIELAR